MPEENVHPLDLRDPAAIQLERIAVALEEQTRLIAKHMKLQGQWQKENREADIGSRILAIHEEQAEREQAYQEKMLHITEAQAREANETIRVGYEAYLQSLKSPSEELVQAVQKAIAKDIRRSTGVRER